MCSALVPGLGPRGTELAEDGIASLTSAPALSTTRTTALRPTRAAKRNDVNPEGRAPLNSAPAASNNDTTSAWPSAAAHISADCPLRSLAFTLAPRDRKGQSALM